MDTTKTVHITPYCEGAAARTDNKPRESNPHSRFHAPLSYAGWEDGWLSENHNLMTVDQQKDMQT